MDKKSFLVLLAEDNEHDIIAAKRIWKKNNISNPLKIVTDGEECLDYLFKQGKYSGPGQAPKPGILLLDINMPKMDGITALKHIRTDERTKRLPVVILTTSKTDEDKKKSYDLGANAYMVKPVDFKNFSDAMIALNNFWEIVELPE